MSFKRDPSSPIEGLRYPNIPIVDEAGLFKSAPGGLLGTEIDAKEFKVLENSITLYIYTSNNKGSNWDNLPFFSSNDIAVFIFKFASTLQLRIKLSYNLILVSRFKTPAEMADCKVVISEKYFKSKKLSIDFVLSLFDTVEEPLFNIVKKEEIERIKKPIKISRTGSVTPIVRIPSGDKLNITIGVFFDGTGNNKCNTKKVHDKIKEEAEKTNKTFTEIAIAKYKEYRDKENEFLYKPKSSYLNNYSNIKELFGLYQETKEGSEEKDKEIIKKIYIAGVGTKKFQEDDRLASGTGKGKYGVFTRSLESIVEIGSLLSKLKEKFSKDKKEIGTVLLDVFGFSRGAASARYIYHMLTTDSEFLKTDLEEAVLDMGKVESYELIKKLYGQGILKIRFYGLFDTVLKTFNTGFSYPTEEDISLLKCDVPCYHIIAQDEIRENFPLTQVDSKNRVVLELYGCHADIGGSYPKDKFTTSFAFDETDKREPSNKLILLFKKYKLQYAVDTSKKHLQYFTKQISIKYKQTRIQKSDNPNIGNERLEGFVTIDERKIESDISTVSLNAMLKFASQHNLPFTIHKKEFSQKLSPQDRNTLLNYNDKVQMMINNVSNIEEVSNFLNINDFFNLYNKFVHISEGYDYNLIENSNNNEYGNNQFIDRPTEKRERVKYLESK